jgi:uncharacterized protein (DUF885 family)
MKASKTIAPLAVALLTVWAPMTPADDDAALEALMAREWAFRQREFPLLASDSGNHEYDDRLAGVSEDDQRRRYEFWKSVRLEMDALDCERLDRMACINLRMFRRQIDQFVAHYEIRAYLIPFTSDWSFFIDWTRLPETTEFKSADDYANYISRLERIPRAMDQHIDLMRTGIETGMTQPRVILAGRGQPILAQLVDDAASSPLMAPFLDRPEDFDAAQWQELTARARHAVQKSVIPAFQRLLTFMRDEYEPGARTTLGALQLPGGERFYREQIRRYATVDMTPAQIHEIGLSEVERIRGEMDAIIEEVGFGGTFGKFLEFLRTDPRFFAETPHQLLAEASYFAKKIDGRLPQLFGRLPRQPYGVAPVPGDLAPFFTTGRYLPAPLEAGRGGYYWVNTHNLESRTLYTLPALTLHEAVPGHHLQGALALEQEHQPPFRRNDYISAYGEGWALYAEKLGVEMDIYETPYQHFGRLTYEMWRACRLVIDTGIHAMGWNRQQALDYLAGNTALSLHEVTTEVDRYISWPAQALSYKLGEYTIWQLRRAAEERLGQDFDLRSFHDFILGLGSVPLDILTDEVRHWTEEQT